MTIDNANTLFVFFISFYFSIPSNFLIKVTAIQMFSQIKNYPMNYVQFGYYLNSIFDKFISKDPVSYILRAKKAAIPSASA